MKPNYGLDLDGPTYNLVGAFDRRMQKKGHNVILPSYNLGKRYGIPLKRGWKHLLEFVEKERAFLHIPLQKGASEAVKHLNKNSNLHIVTARQYSEQEKQDTYTRLKQDFPFLNIKEQLAITYEKGEFAKKHNITIFYDDLIANALDIIEKSSALVKLVDQDHNQELADNPRIIRFPSLYEAVFGN